MIKPLELWTGKQVMSVLMRPSLQCPVFVNIDLKEKIYTSNEHLCPKDGYVSIVNSELVSGRIGKGLLGGAKDGLFGTLAARYSAKVAGSIPLSCDLCELLHSTFQVLIY
jgi:DNA-directed RNA polymerase III subunit RPC1